MHINETTKQMIREIVVELFKEVASKLPQLHLLSAKVPFLVAMEYTMVLDAVYADRRSEPYYTKGLSTTEIAPIYAKKSQNSLLQLIPASTTH